MFSDSVLGANDESLHRWGQQPGESLLWAATKRWALHICDLSLGSHVGDTSSGDEYR